MGFLTLWPLGPVGGGLRRGGGEVRAGRRPGWLGAAGGSGHGLRPWMAGRRGQWGERLRCQIERGVNAGLSRSMQAALDELEGREGLAAELQRRGLGRLPAADL